VEAKDALDKAAAIDPKSVTVMAAQVEYDLKHSRTQDARKRVETALAQHGRDVRFLIIAARAYGQFGEINRSEELLRTALEIEPANIQLYSMLGSLYLDQKRLPEARVTFEGMVKQKPDSVPALTMLGLIAQLSNDVKTARTNYERVIQLDSSAPVAANNLAWLMATTGGNLDVALQLAQGAKRRLPDNASIDDTLGWIYYKKNLPSLAIAALKQSVNRDPQNAETHYHLGMAYAKSGDKARAREHLQKALSINAQFEGSEEARKTLNSLG
jgi:tetratricopeptide (TPR) repeat protein